MRIGLITGEYPPDQGGVGDFTHELACSLTELGHEVHVVTHAAHPTQHTPSDGDQESPILHRVVESWGWGCWKQILALAKDLSLDVLNVQYQAAAYDMHPAINIVPGRERPLVIATFHDLKVPYLFPKAGPLRRWVVHMLARRSDGTIVTNREDELAISNLQPGIPNLTRIPIGSNIPPNPPADYDQDEERARWGVGPDDLLLGYFGFLNESKGGEELIQALALLVERGLPAHLLMVGGQVGSSDPTNRAYADKVKHLIADLGITDRVHWSGYSRPSLVSAGLLATDVCVLPYRDGVSFRRGTLHACLAHGRAIVTTKPAIPLPEITNGETMLLVPPRDPQGLAEAVMQLQADPQLQAHLASQAKALAATFSWEQIARQTTAFFRTLLNGAGG